ncbi:MAG: ABC transporter permease subunit, partial [Selenomonas sp.]|nr:ABC transporter permease subunit [Selenomonas sp.]
LLGGTVIIETIFNWPGIGSLIMTAISNRDYPVIQAAVVWMVLAYFVVNLLADLSYRRFNPRVRGC